GLVHVDVFVGIHLKEYGEPTVEAHAESGNRLQHRDIAWHTREFIHADREIHCSWRECVAGFEGEQARITVESRHWNVLGDVLGIVVRQRSLRFWSGLG